MPLKLSALTSKPLVNWSDEQHFDALSRGDMPKFDNGDIIIMICEWADLYKKTYFFSFFSAMLSLVSCASCHL